MESVWLGGYVLHSRPYRETSQIVDMFTRERGRMSLVAKGVRNGRHEKRALLQLFHPLRFQCKGKSQLLTLTQLESAGRSLAFVGDALFCAMYVNELLMRVLPEGFESSALFDHYLETLHLLSVTENMSAALREFEFHLLNELGVLPDCEAELDGTRPIRENLIYRLVSEQGFVRIDVRSNEPGAYSGAAILAYAQRQWTDEALVFAKFLHRYLLKLLLGNKPLKSRELFRRR